MMTTIHTDEYPEIIREILKDNKIIIENADGSKKMTLSDKDIAHLFYIFLEKIRMTPDLTTAISNDALLFLKRAAFDVYIRNCGIVCERINTLWEEAHGYPCESFNHLISAVAGVCVEANSVPNPTKQCGLDTRFADAMRENLTENKL